MSGRVRGPSLRVGALIGDCLQGQGTGSNAVAPGPNQTARSRATTSAWSELWMRLSISRPSARALRRVPVPSRPRIVSGPASAGSVGAERGAQPGGGIGSVAERDHDRMAEVDAAQLSGHIYAEFGRQRQDVGVMGEDLLGCRVQDALSGDADMLGDHGQHRADEVVGQAVRLESPTTARSWFA
jgi:hypothetical protein